MDTHTLLQMLKKNGYGASLFHIDDIKYYFDITDEQAFNVIEEVADGDYMSEVFTDLIMIRCEEYGYKYIAP